MDEGQSKLFEDRFFILDHQGVLRYWESGDRTKPGIIFLHGIGSGVESWLAQFKFLSEYYFVIAIDIPGFGKSRIANHNYEIKSFLDVLDAFIKRKHISELSLVGHSLGGLLALEYANLHPSTISKLVLIASAGSGMPSKRFRFLGGRFSRLFLLPLVKTDFLGPRIFRFFYGNGLPSIAYERLSSHWKEPLTTKSFVTVLGRSRDHTFVNTSSISCPSLILWGMNDWVLDYRYANVLASKLPCAELKLFKGFGHAIHTEIPETINPLILGFLSSSEPDRR